MQEKRSEIIGTIKTPLGLFVLFVLIIEAGLFTLSFRADLVGHLILIITMCSSFMMVMIGFFLIFMFRPHVFTETYVKELLDDKRLEDQVYAAVGAGALDLNNILLRLVMKPGNVRDVQRVMAALGRLAKRGLVVPDTDHYWRAPTLLGLANPRHVPPLPENTQGTGGTGAL